MPFIELLLFGDDEDRRFVSALLPKHHGVERMRCYNWHVASKHSATWRSTHGHKIDGLTLPLFLPGHGHDAQNAAMLSPQVPDGGGVNPGYRSPAQRIFREPELTGYLAKAVSKLHHHEDDPLGGEFHAPVVVYGDGHAVNLTAVENAFKVLQERVTRLAREVESLTSRNRRAENPPGYFASRPATNGRQPRNNQWSRTRPNGGEQTSEQTPGAQTVQPAPPAQAGPPAAANRPSDFRPVLPHRA